MPGLLQSSGYAAAVLDGFQHLILGDAFLDRYETHFLQRFRSDRSSS